jgi:hypothetical protein
MASYRSAFCKPFGKPTELHWACSSSFYPFDSLSSEGYSWFACLMFLLDRSSEVDMECQSSDQLQLLRDLFRMPDQWSVILHYWWLFLGLRTSGRWLHRTSSFSAWHQQPTRKSFYPFRDIVDGNQDVLTPFWVREWPHEINSLDIEDINLEIWNQWHCIPCNDIFVPLTFAAASNKWLGIIIHGGPVETTLPHLSIGVESSIVTPIWWWMTTLKYLPCLKSLYASS